MGKGRGVPHITKLLSNGEVKEKAKGTVRFLEGVEILRGYLTEVDDEAAELKLEKLRDYRRSIHALAAEKKLRN